jgi:hypothetical protein
VRCGAPGLFVVDCLGYVLTLSPSPPQKKPQQNSIGHGQFLSAWRQRTVLYAHWTNRVLLCGVCSPLRLFLFFFFVCVAHFFTALRRRLLILRSANSVNVFVCLFVCLFVFFFFFFLSERGPAGVSGKQRPLLGTIFRFFEQTRLFFCQICLFQFLFNLLIFSLGSPK